MAGLVGRICLVASRTFSSATVAMSKAFVQRKAPDFAGQAVLPNGSFGQVKLADYSGALIRHDVNTSHEHRFFFCRKIPCVIFLSS